MSIERALTIIDPLAYLIVAGWKSIENRTWQPRNQDGSPFRGRIAIHTSRSTRLFRDSDAVEDIIDTDPHGQIETAMDDGRIGNGRHLFHLGHIIGSVEIAGVIRLSSAEDWQDELETALRTLPAPTGFAAEIPEADWVQSDTLFVLRNARRYRRAIPAAGKLNMWKLSEAQQRLVAEAEDDLINQNDPGCPAERMAL